MRRLLPIVGLVVSAWGALPIHRAAAQPADVADLTEAADRSATRGGDHDGPAPALVPPPVVTLPEVRALVIESLPPPLAVTQLACSPLTVAPKTSPPFAG